MEKNMGIKFQITNDELLCLYTPDFNYDEELKRINKSGCHIKNTFYVEKKDLLEVKEDDLFEEPICFSVGKRKGDYIQLNKNIFGIDNNFYFLSNINFEQKLFTAYKNISIIHKIDNLIDYDFFVGEENRHENEISSDLYLELVKKFPNSTELKHYAHSRISTILKETLPQFDKYEIIYEKYISKYKQPSLARINDKESAMNIEIELEQFTTALDELKSLLQDVEHTEKYWQNKICPIIQLIYPKYILCKREMQFKGIDDYDKQPDFVLVDANGFVDILEIKKPNVKILTKQSSYRNNYVPVRNLSGSIQQIEKYLVCLNKLNPEKDEFFSKLKESLPSNINPVALNPQGILLLGRSNQFNDQQKNDFELIKRQYKHITDIMTYDDLVIRLENIVNSLKIRLKND